jgi:hypothetical protein
MKKERKSITLYKTGGDNHEVLYRIYQAKDYKNPTEMQLTAMRYNPYAKSYSIPKGEEGIDTIKQILAYCQDHKLKSPTFAELFMQDKSNFTEYVAVAQPILKRAKFCGDFSDRENDFNSDETLYRLICEVPLNQSPFFMHEDGNFYYNMLDNSYEEFRKNGEEFAENYCEPFITSVKKEVQALDKSFCEIIEISINEKPSLCHIMCNVKLAKYELSPLYASSENSEKLVEPNACNRFSYTPKEGSWQTAEIEGYFTKYLIDARVIAYDIAFLAKRFSTVIDCHEHVEGVSKHHYLCASQDSTDYFYSPLIKQHIFLFSY